MDELVRAYLFAHYMNIMYGVAAICISLKLAYIGRQVSVSDDIPAWQSLWLRVAAALTGSAILWKATMRFHGGDQAYLIDVVREFSWCGFLAAAIVILKSRFGNW